MTFTLTIDCDNDAFAFNDLATELARIVGKVAQDIDDDGIGIDPTGTVRDINGNTVGRWEIVS